MESAAAAVLPRASWTPIVEAALRLLRTAGLDGLTTRAVAEAAGVQPPAIYRIFGDKDGLLAAVAEHAIAQYVAEKRVAGTSGKVPEGDPLAGLHSAWDLHIAFGLDNPEVYALLSSRANAVIATAVQDGVDVLRGHIRRLLDTGLLRVTEDRAAQMIHATGHGVVLALLEQSPAERDDGLADAVFDAVAAAIVVQTGDDDSRDRGALESCVDFLGRLHTLPALSAGEKALLTEWMRRVIEALR